jgi:hypothetical protein
VQQFDVNEVAMDYVRLAERGSLAVADHA